ncbi:C40 family peptidase [Nocardioides plantarum]|uniref:C40 family peptidase n=1 Tax=Nocardioides plantarum TaxID=29299 RepID=A0ABV5KB30_9ACTN|nr:C40 family peptidase [Nocardioides plantarum]
MAASLTVACALVAGLTVAAHADDDSPVPTRSEVRDARAAAQAGQRDVAGVRAELAAAHDAAEQTQVRAAKAAEAYNGARYAAGQARDKAALARAAEVDATAQVRRLGVTYRRAALNTYTGANELAVVDSVLEADGLSSLLDELGSARMGQQALGSRAEAFHEAEDAAAAARDRADKAKAEADAKAAAAQKAHDQAQALADEAVQAEQAAAAREKQLVAELARLQGVSVRLAQSREDGLARKAAEAAAERAARAEQARREEARREQSRRDELARQERVRQQAARDRADRQDRQDQQDQQEDTPDPAPAPDPDPAPAPSPSGGAAAAVAFARNQLGEPYVWAAAGPDQWDCSGLTMGAWSAGGKSLPHYSVAQYEQSTPISASDLQPGDLVFWSDGGPSQIYHVALYAGNGMIIHAPRPGKPVTEESLYYWITPSFYARP